MKMRSQESLQPAGLVKAIAKNMANNWLTSAVGSLATFDFSTTALQPGGHCCLDHIFIDQRNFDLERRPIDRDCRGTA